MCPEYRVTYVSGSTINKIGLPSTVIVGRKPFLLVVLDTFAKRSQQLLIIRPDFVSAIVGGESLRKGVLGR
jgi:hypothetical protein